MNDLPAQIDRCRERTSPAWRMTLPLAGIAAGYVVTATFLWLGRADDKPALTAMITVLFAGVLGVVWRDLSTKRQKLERAFAAGRSSALGFHDLYQGLVFVTPDGIFIESTGGLVPFSGKVGEPRIAACAYLTPQHALRLELRGLRDDVVLELALPPTIKPQQAEEAVRLSLSARGEP